MIKGEEGTMQKEGYTELGREHLIMVSTFPGSDDHNFVIYRDDSDERFPIHICERFSIRNDGQKIYVEIDNAFDRRLEAQNIEELNAMTLAELKDEAYGSYMDGVRR